MALEDGPAESKEKPVDTRPSKPKAPKGYILIPIWRACLTGGLLLVFVLCMGMVHITCGGGGGPGICPKESWGLGDTFVDLDDYIDKSFLENIHKAHVMRAMFECEKLQRPDGR